MLRVLLADNHAVARDGIRRILAHDHRVQVVEEASGFLEAITKAHNTKADVVILDVHMPLGPGLLAGDLNAQLGSCGAQVLGISFTYDDDARSLAASIGVTELLDKTTLGMDLIPAIMRVASASNWFPPTVSVKRNRRRVAS